MKEREAKFLDTREQEHTKSLAAGESNNVACHSFPGLSKEWSDFGREVNVFFAFCECLLCNGVLVVFYFGAWLRFCGCGVVESALVRVLNAIDAVME